MLRKREIKKWFVISVFIIGCFAAAGIGQDDPQYWGPFLEFELFVPPVLENSHLLEPPTMCREFSSPISYDEDYDVSVLVPGLTNSKGINPGPVNPTNGIHLATGEFCIAIEDLYIPGRGLDFHFARWYRSRTFPNTREGHIGNGWTHSYNIYIEKLGKHRILHNGTGRMDLYTLQQSNLWGMDGHFRALTLGTTEEIGYKLTFKDGGVWNFYLLDGSSTAGKIKRIRDNDGNNITFGYDSSGLLENVYDTLGRTITFAYNDDYNIISMTDFAGRTFSYTYYDGIELGGSEGDLKSVTSPGITGTPNGNDFPEGKTTFYTYSAGNLDGNLNHNLTSITDPLGQVYLQNTYATTTDINDVYFDHIVQQTWGNPGDVIDLTYSELTPAKNNNFAVKKTCTNGRMGNIIEFFYNERNLLVMTLEYTGQAGDPNAPTSITESINLPENPLREGADPKYYQTKYKYNDDFLLTRIDYPMGNYRTYIYERDYDYNCAGNSLKYYRRSSFILGYDSWLRKKGNLRERCRHYMSIEKISSSLLKKSNTDGSSDKTKWSSVEHTICERFEWDPYYNLVTRHVKGNETEVQYSYGAGGNRISKINVRKPPHSNIEENWEFNIFGQVETHILPDNGSKNQRRDEYTYYENPLDPQYGYLKEAIVDANTFSFKFTFVYDQVGNLIDKEDPLGNHTQFIPNQLNQVVQVILPEVTPGSNVYYTKDIFYDLNDNVIQVDVRNIDDRGQLQSNAYFTTSFEYGILNNVISEIKEVDFDHFVVIEYGYNANFEQNLIRFGEETNGNQEFNTEEIRYDERGYRFKITRANGDPDQSTDQFNYNLNGYLKGVHQGLENTPNITVHKYNGFDQLTQSIDSMGNRKTYKCDKNDNLIREFLYGELNDVPGSNGNIRLKETNYWYDNLDRLACTEVSFFTPSSQTDIGDGKVTTLIEYNNNSQVVKETKDNGNEIEMQYDTANRLKTVSDKSGNGYLYTYDYNSNILQMREFQVIQTGGDVVFNTDYEYDNLNRLIKVTDNMLHTTEYAYDSQNNRTWELDANGKETRHFFDGLKRKTGTVYDMDGNGADPSDPDDISINQTWDDDSRLIGQTDGKSNTTNYEYDPLNRLIKTTFADGTTKQIGYDVHDNPVFVSDANGSVNNSTYDLLNRVTAKSITPGTGVSYDTTFENYKYCGAGCLIYAEDDDSLLTRSYNSLSHIAQETLRIGGITSPTRAITSVHDSLGNKTACVYPSGRTITVSYDVINRKKEISDAAGSIVTYSYIGPTRIDFRVYGNGTGTQFNYNDIKQIVGTKTDGPWGPIDVRTYAWNPMDYKTERKDIRGGGPQLTHIYSYDSIGRLFGTVVRDSNWTIIRQTPYSLDDVGNRFAVGGSGPDPGPYTMDNTTPEPADDQMNQYTTTPLRTPVDSRLYDKNGSMITCDSGLPSQKDFTYDYRNQMVEVADSSNSQVHTYSWDPLGRRIERIIDSTGSPQTTRYYYDRWQVIEEQDGSDVTQATYVYGNYIDEVLTMQRGGEDYYFHTDDLSNVMATTDSNGTVVERYEYEDYGRSVDPSTLVPISGSPSAIGNSYLFTGRRYDEETGFYYYRTRFLEPRVGRFSTRDTLGIWGDTDNLGNGYSYLSNNPLSKSDPYGQGPKCWKLATKGATQACREEARRLRELKKLCIRKVRAKYKGKRRRMLIRECKDVYNSKIDNLYKAFITIDEQKEMCLLKCKHRYHWRNTGCLAGTTLIGLIIVPLGVLPITPSVDEMLEFVGKFYRDCKQNSKLLYKGCKSNC